MATAPKLEPIDAVNLDSRILDLLAEYPNGMFDSELREKISHIPDEQRVAAINYLLTKGKIDLIRAKNTDMIGYKLRNAETQKKIEGADIEEKLIYHIVEESGNKGIWVREIRTKANLPHAHLNKLLKNLEQRKLIKSVKTVGAVRRKVYMLFELEPDASITGGTFYADQEFDGEFAMLLGQQCEKYLQMKAQVAAERFLHDHMMRKKASSIPSGEVLEHIHQLKISNIDLKPQDIEMVLNTLVWDGKAEKIVGPSSVMLYRSIKSTLPDAGLMRSPCGGCPVFDDCCPGNIISPATCQYMKEWLNL